MNEFKCNLENLSSYEYFDLMQNVQKICSSYGIFTHIHYDEIPKIVTFSFETKQDLTFCLLVLNSLPVFKNLKRSH